MNSIRFLLAALLLSAPVNAIAQENPLLAAGRSAWQNGDYRAAYKKLKAYRDKAPSSTFSIDYMLATGACRLPTHRQLGKTLLDLLAQGEYPGPAQWRAVAGHESTQCLLAKPSDRAEGLPTAAPDSPIRPIDNSSRPVESPAHHAGMVVGIPVRHPPPSGIGSGPAGMSIIRRPPDMEAATEPVSPKRRPIAGVDMLGHNTELSDKVVVKPKDTKIDTLLKDHVTRESVEKLKD